MRTNPQYFFLTSKLIESENITVKPRFTEASAPRDRSVERTSLGSFGFGFSQRCLMQKDEVQRIEREGIETLKEIFEVDDKTRLAEVRAVLADIEGQRALTKGSKAKHLQKRVESKSKGKTSG